MNDNCEEVEARMTNAQCFTVIDASSGFWKIALDYQCYWRDFRGFPKRYGLAVFDDSPCEIKFDNILIEEDHNQKLLKLLNKAKEVNLLIIKIWRLRTSSSKQKRSAIGPPLYKGIDVTLHILLRESAWHMRNATTREAQGTTTPYWQATYLSILRICYLVVGCGPTTSIWSNQNQIQHRISPQDDVKKPVLLTCEASKKGLGAARL